MALYFRTLASGSSGNCVFVSNGKTHILIDAGITMKSVKSALGEMGVQLTDVSAILVTHEHSDHICGVDMISLYGDIPIYATQKEWKLLDGQYIKRAAAKNRVAFNKKEDFFIGDFNIQPFATPHDAYDPCGYSIFHRGKHIVIATDLGHTNQNFTERVKNADLVLLESNYDEGMLRDGSYPYALKQRILGRNGHLSNDDCAAALSLAVTSGSLRRVILGHLSQNNNTPQLALETSQSALLQMGLRPDRDILLKVSPRRIPGELICL